MKFHAKWTRKIDQQKALALFGEGLFAERLIIS
jgi:hypothetical protein